MQRRWGCARPRFLLVFWRRSHQKPTKKRSFGGGNATPKSPPLFLLVNLPLLRAWLTLSALVWPRWGQHPRGRWFLQTGTDLQFAQLLALRVGLLRNHLLTRSVLAVDVFRSYCQNSACPHGSFTNLPPDLLPYSPWRTEVHLQALQADELGHRSYRRVAAGLGVSAAPAGRRLIRGRAQQRGGGRGREVGHGADQRQAGGQAAPRDVRLRGGRLLQLRPAARGDLSGARHGHAVFASLERHWPKLVNAIESERIPKTNNTAELVNRRFDQHDQTFCGFDTITTAQTSLAVFAWCDRFTPFTPDAQKRIRGKCPLELAGYDVASLPMAQICCSQMLHWPPEALGAVVPRT